MKHLAAFRHQIWAIVPGAMDILDAQAAAVADLVSRGIGRPEPRAELSPADSMKVAYNGGNTVVPEIVDGVATIEIMGCLLGRAPWWAKAYMGAIDPFDIADAVDALAADAGVKSLVIEVDSGGGSTAGTAEARAALDRFQAAGKTIEVRVAGYLGSATYWLCAGADRIIATATSMIGFCGTFFRLCDSTAAQATMGLKYEVISSPAAKGLGADGAVTEPLRAMYQRWADGITAQFRDAVAAGRGMSEAQLDAVFTGDGWLADQALALGLIDVVGSPADELDKPTGSAQPPDPAVPPLEAVDDDDPAAKSSSPPAPTLPTPAAAAASSTESTMDANTQAALTALSQSHPHLASALIPEATKAGATAASLELFVAKADATAAQAALTAAQATATDAQAKATAAQTKAAADLAAKDSRIKQLEQIAGIAQNSGDVGGDQAGKVRLIPGSQAGRLSKADLADIENGRAQLNYGADAMAAVTRNANGVSGPEAVQPAASEKN